MNKPVTTDKAIDKFLSKYFRDQNNESLDASLLKPTLDLLERGGKRWRPKLMLAVYTACGGKDDISKYLPVIELLHNATLVHDDIEDNSNMRRGKEALHILYGEDIAVNVGSWMFFSGLSIIKNELKLLRIAIEELDNCHRGQAMDILWHKTNYVPNEREYLTMTALKTGSLASMAARFGAVLAGTDEKTEKKFSEFAKSLGIAFQIQDDILNISGNLGKSPGDDITEGKKTLLVIRCLEKATKSETLKLLKILKSHTESKTKIKEAIKIITKYDSIEYSQKIAHTIVKNAWNELIITGNINKELEEFKHFAVDRKV